MSRSPSPLKTLLFTIVAVVVLPALLLLALEGGLRLAGYGHAPEFLRARTLADGSRVWSHNARFGWRFFPPEIARAPQNVLLPREKGADTVRIFVLGGSAAMGDPAPFYGLPRMLQAQLEIVRPDLRFEVVNAAMTAINSHVVLPIATDCLKADPDFLVVYAGNNEVVGPYGVGSVFGAPGADLAAIRAQVALKSWRLGQAVERIGGALRGGGGTPENWSGMEQFLETRLAPDDPRLERVYSHFRANLTSLVERANAKGVPVLLSTVAVNLADSAPFGSEGGDGESADWHYVRGGERRAAGETAEAAAAFGEALQRDRLRFRTDAQQNAIIRDVAGKADATLVPGAAAVAALAPDGIAGREAFDDHVHLTFAGNHALARAVAEAVLAQLPAGPVQPWPSLEACEARLGYAPYARRSTVDTMLKRRGRAPFTAQIDRDVQRGYLEAELATLERADQPHQLRKALEAVRRSLREHPEDFTLRSIFGDLLLRTDALQQALEERDALAALFPADSDAQYARASVLARLGREEEAEAGFRRTVELFPGHFLAQFALGERLAAAGDPEAALAHFAEATLRHPDYLEAWRATADAQLQLERPREALPALERAAALAPTVPGIPKKQGDAHRALGELEAASAAYARALAIFPEFVVAHEARAGVQERLGDVAGAREHWRRVLELRPEHEEAAREIERLS